MTFNLYKKIPKLKNYKSDILSQGETNRLLEKWILKEESFMAARLGSVECDALRTYLQINTLQKANPLVKLYYFGKGYRSNWGNVTLENLNKNAGFFYRDSKDLDRFCELYLQCLSKIDLMGIWFNIFEDYIVTHFSPKARLTMLSYLEPYNHSIPWSSALKNKTILVIHPFKNSIEKQYRKRELLFDNVNVLPDFNIKTIKAVQSHANQKVSYESWFDALQFLLDEIADTEFDLAIIGAGAYGLPMASFIKSMGKQAVHLGGATQILFGIKGNRWDNHPIISKLYNQYWIRPSLNETPRNSHLVEKECYW